MVFQLPPIEVASIQSAVLAATSNLLAQVITAFRYETPLIIDWVPIFQFLVFNYLNTHPNVLWQEFLESTWPAYHAAPTAEAVASASKGDDKELEKEEAEGKLVEPKLNLGNTAVKMALDQTVGAAFNTVVFGLFIHGVQQAMPRPLGAPLSTPDRSADYLLALASGGVKTSPVDWSVVQAKVAAEFWPMIFAGLKLWPLISFINFAFVKSITGRNLLGSLAGVGWNIYLSLVAGQ
ncbi:Mpv17/PMP22 family protein [Pestalotiopsis sp. NC0098]|nr:Mpv17/PMP22 family protein [Pestalotiopsis sp. NC0098]